MTSALPRRTAAAVVLVLSLVLAACGSSKNAPETSSPAPTDADAAADGAIELESLEGTITLDEPATEIVSIQWSHTEDLLALGIKPVGVADIDGYRTWVRAEPTIPDGVTDIGDRDAPSIERIRGLAPDLIIAGEDADPDALDTMRTITTVLVLDDYADDRPEFDTMKANFRTIAKATGRETEAEQVLEDLDAKIAEGRAALDEVDLSTRSVVLSQGDGSVESPLFRLFTGESQVIQIMEQLGLENGWDGPDEGYGFNTVSMEALTEIEDAWFLTVVQPEDLEAFLDRFAENPLWTSLSFVEDERVRALGGDVWFFGGPLSADYLVDALVDTFTE